MNFKPLNKRILVKRAAEETTTSTGIIIPDNAKEKPQTAEVIAVAADAEGIKVGDKVVFGKYSGTEIKLEGSDYLILNADDVLGIL